MRWWRIAAVIVAIHGTFCLIGGWIGFFRADSWISAIAGSSAFVILIPCAWGLWREHHVAAYIAVAVSLILDARFIYAYTLDRKLMPHMTMIILSSLSATAAATALIYRYCYRRKHRHGMSTK